jgi:hypothetical protein
MYHSLSTERDCGGPQMMVGVVSSVLANVSAIAGASPLPVDLPGIISLLSSSAAAAAAAASGQPALQQAAQAAATRAQRAVADGVAQIAAAQASSSRDALRVLLAGVPRLVAPALERQLQNLTRPEVVATLPVVGPTLACLSAQLASGRVNKVVNTAKRFADGLKVPRVALLVTASADPCRDLLDANDCSGHWDSVYPSGLPARQELFGLALGLSGLPEPVLDAMNQSAAAYSTATVPRACTVYESLGCASITTVSVEVRRATGWLDFVNTTRDLMDTYLGPIDETLNYVTYYVDTRIFPCYVTGHVVGFVSAMVITLNVLHQFNCRLIEMREGKRPYKHVFAITQQSTFSSTSTPTLGGMVLATAYAQYYVSAFKFISEPNSVPVLGCLHLWRNADPRFHAHGVCLSIPVVIGLYRVFHGGR